MPLVRRAGLGLLTARGSVKLNGFHVWNNGTVVDGMVVITEAVGATITLNSGAEILLAPASRIRFREGIVSLEAGSVMIRHPGQTRLQASVPVTTVNGALLAGRLAPRIPALLESLAEERPRSQRP